MRPDPETQLAHLRRIWRLVATLLVATGLACVGGPDAAQVVDRFEGEASFYADSLEGRPTANGETFSQAALTAAHRELPFGTELRVTVPESGKSVTVRVNDRGPYAKDRVLDLTRSAAEVLGFIDAGTAHVMVEVLAPREPAAN